MRAFISKYRYLFICLAIIVATFPDIVLGPGSLMATDHMRFDGQKSSLSIYPPKKMNFKGFADIGGTVWQSDPKIPYVKYLLETGESPYWNPYLGTGTLGPEGLIDIMFSPLTFLSAALGASSLAVSVVILFFLGLGMYCLLRLCVDLLSLPLLAGVAAAMAYMFNGFHISGLGLNYTQSYLLFPLYLYALMAFAKHGGSLRFIGAYVSAALLLTLTFIPTTTLVIGATTLLGLGYALQQQASWKRMALIAAAPLCGVLLTACIYLPIAGALAVTSDLDTYAARTFYPATLNGFLSFFTPRHLWMSYRHQADIMGEPSYPLFMGNMVFHIGIVGGLLALCCLRRVREKPLFLLFALGLSTALLLRIFGMPVFDYDVWKWASYRHTAILRTLALIALFSWGIYHYRLWKKPAILTLASAGFFAVFFSLGIDTYDRIINAIPVIGKFAEQYVWVAVMICFPFIIAYGMAAICRGAPLFSLARHYIAFLLLLFGYLLALTPLEDFRLSMTTYIPGFLLTLYVLYRFCRRDLDHTAWATLPLALVGLLFAEYWYYTNHFHPMRNDLYNKPPEYVTLIKEQIGHHRIVSLGIRGLPGDQGAAFQIPDISVMTLNVPIDYQRFFLKELLSKEHNFNNNLHFVSAVDNGELDLSLTSLMGVKYILAPRAWTSWERTLTEKGLSTAFQNQAVAVYEHPAPWPRAFTTTQPVSSLTADTVKNGTLKPSDVAPASIVAYGHTEIVIETTSKAPATLVLTDSWYPHWRATVNGENTSIEKAFTAFRGVSVPAGKTTVRFYYDNPYVTWGLRVSAAMALFTLSLASITILRRRFA